MYLRVSLVRAVEYNHIRKLLEEMYSILMSKEEIGNCVAILRLSPVLKVVAKGFKPMKRVLRHCSVTSLLHRYLG